MSSLIDGDAAIGAAVVIPGAAMAAAGVAVVAVSAGVIYGAGWALWQTGKLLVDANSAVDQRIAEKRRLLAQEADNRRNLAVAAHNQLVQVCTSVIAQLEAGVQDSKTKEHIAVLRSISTESIPEDTGKLESMTTYNYGRLNDIVNEQKQIAEMRLSEEGRVKNISVADMMDSMRVAIAAMEISATEGFDAVAVDAEVLQRAKLNKRLSAVVDRMVEALGFVQALEETNGLSASALTWFNLCFEGADKLIEALRNPATSNEELQKGVVRLEESMYRFDSQAAAIEKDARKMALLYDVYVNASKALGEKVEPISSFKDSEALEKRLRELDERTKRAEECARVYAKLGPQGYICYAMDQELKEMGYRMHTRRGVAALADKTPENAEIDGKVLPFYEWGDDLTQLYEIAQDCNLQLIVHEDGTVSMKTIAEDEEAEVEATQHLHCSQLKVLRERLRERWFIFYDYEELESADKVTTVASWKSGTDFAWGKGTAPGRGVKDGRGIGIGTGDQTGNKNTVD